MFLKFNQKIVLVLSLMGLITLIVMGVVILPSNSALALSNCACVTSEAQPQIGQSTRSSGNFSTQGCTTSLKWELPDGINVDIIQDVSGGRDRGWYNVSNDTTKQNPNQRSLYIGNPKGANKPFQVCALNID
ncbi:hypothetical protein [Nostoc sp. ChiVER01]|uniref:hypothetical protein n=1 Tax=Nostoc sp. ChiVER01 TaxID=3075382 RepID=UPI002AD38797|nr:hypothetical protein [Nostoc sp. ChiVER01]MDZ8223707.1 hypothetical protein [Nostoc sp. ChiVER01]